MKQPCRTSKHVMLAERLGGGDIYVYVFAPGVDVNAIKGKLLASKKADVEGLLYADLDKDDRVLGVEILSPDVKIGAVLDALRGKEEKT